MEPLLRTLQRRGIALVLLPTLALAGLPTSVRGAPLAPGTRLRVTVLERAPAESLFVGEGSQAGRSFLGRVLERQGDGLVLEPDAAAGTRLTLHRPAIVKLEISRGPRSRTGRGALLGLIGGGLGGTLLGIHI
ncbi:MAG: hypothetical protein ABIP29_10930, partial [Candidatus Eisenbacteria bacterium]